MSQLLGIGPVAAPMPQNTVLRWRERWQQRWSDASPRTRTAVQLTTLLVAVGVAYNYTLSALLANAGLETPLAYISLVPPIALGLAAVRARPRRFEPPIHDRELDYIVGIPLIAVALAMEVALPRKLSAMFWVWRIDLLSLPLFVAGATAVIFGVRALWRQKLAVGYLLLAWPVPYSLVLLRVLDGFTSMTLFGLRGALHVLPVAKPVPSPDGSLFEVVHAGHAFPLSVVSACSGINGVVGFLLIGAAFGAIVDGPRVRKVLWLVGGMLLLWAVNVGRLVFIFWAGRAWGEHVAIDVLHPFVGLLTFGLGVAVMLLFLRPLGLGISLLSAPRPPGPVEETVVATGQRRSTAVPKVYAAMAVVLVAALALGLADAGLRVYNVVATAAGEPKLLPYKAQHAAPEGWRARLTTEFTWARPLFGDDSTWDRYALVASSGGGDLPESFPVSEDVIDTGDLQSFSAYGIEACYQFHGFTLRDVAQVDLGGGITGQTLSYSTSAQRESWSIVYWIVPVRSGSSTRYERNVLYVLDGSSTAFRLPPHVPGLKNLAGTLSGQGADRQLVAAREFLAAFARELIARQANSAHPGVPPAPHPGTRQARAALPIR